MVNTGSNYRWWYWQLIDAFAPLCRAKFINALKVVQHCRFQSVSCPGSWEHQFFLTGDELCHESNVYFHHWPCSSTIPPSTSSNVQQQHGLWFWLDIPSSWREYFYIFMITFNFPFFSGLSVFFFQATSINMHTHYFSSHTVCLELLTRSEFVQHGR